MSIQQRLACCFPRSAPSPWPLSTGGFWPRSLARARIRNLRLVFSVQTVHTRLSRYSFLGFAVHRFVVKLPCPRRCKSRRGVTPNTVRRLWISLDALTRAGNGMARPSQGGRDCAGCAIRRLALAILLRIVGESLAVHLAWWMGEPSRDSTIPARARRRRTRG